MTKAEIGGYLGISTRSVTNLMRRRALPFVKLGRIVRFNASECDEALGKFRIRSVGGVGV
jgi:excisionase family DNA binding protein